MHTELCYYLPTAEFLLREEHDPYIFLVYYEGFPLVPKISGAVFWRHDLRKFSDKALAPRYLCPIRKGILITEDQDTHMPIMVHGSRASPGPIIGAGLLIKPEALDHGLAKVRAYLTGNVYAVFVIKDKVTVKKIRNLYTQSAKEALDNAKDRFFANKA